MALKLNSSSGGSVTLQEPTTASNYTLTVPAQTATLAINGPAFSAYQNTGQTISNNTVTKISINTEEFDTNNNFDPTTNYRFTPTVAGYYQINFACGLSGSTVNGLLIGYIYKNGSNYKNAYGSYQSTTGNGGTLVSAVIYMNGTTDYIEFYFYQNTGASQPTVGGAGGQGVWANGSLVRAA